MGDRNENEIVTKKRALEKAMKYCAYQERSHLEVRQKILSWGVPEEDADEVISELVLENFLNESRFAEAYTRGKLRLKRWGKQKIKQGLLAKDVSEYCMKDALESIDQEEYFSIFSAELEKKVASVQQPFSFEGKGKIAAYLIRRGWEPQMVWSELKQIEKDNDK